MKIGAATVMLILSTADLKPVTNVIINMAMKIHAIIHLQALKVKNISIATNVVLEWAQVKI